MEVEVDIDVEMVTQMDKQMYSYTEEDIEIKK